VPERDPCPVTELSIDTTNLVIPGTTVSKLGGGKYLRVSRDENKQPLVDLMVSFEDLPCLDPSASHYRYDTHTLLLNSYSDCGKYGVDKESRVIHAVHEVDLYRFNGMMEKLISLPIYLKSISGKRAFLVSRPRLALKDHLECYRIDLNMIYEISHELSDVYMWFNTIIVTSMILSIIIVLIPCCTNDNVGMRMNYLNMRFNFGVIWVYALQTFLLLLCLWAVSERCSHLQSQHSQFQALTRFSCFGNENASKALKDIAEEILKAAENVPGYLLSLIAINVLGAVVSYFDLVLNTFGKDKRLKSE